MNTDQACSKQPSSSDQQAYATHINRELLTESDVEPLEYSRATLCTNPEDAREALGAKRDGISRLGMYVKLWEEHKPSHNLSYLPFYDILVHNEPLMSISSLNENTSTPAANFLSLLANSIRREAADMYVFILPGLHERCTTHIFQEDSDDLKNWWSGFLSYTFSAMTGTETALKGLYSEYERVRAKVPQEVHLELTKRYHRVVNTVTSGFEAPLRRLDESMKELLDFRSKRHLLAMEKLWRPICKFVLQSFNEAYLLVGLLEARDDFTFSSKGIQRAIMDMLRVPKYARHVGITRHRSNVLIAMVRWMATEDDIRNWTAKNFGKGLDLDKAAILYAWHRRICKFQIDRKPSTSPLRIGSGGD